jgi:predicted house-cleaning NTP pyrophosphatase (Maf/HAM1 superfamily)
LRVEQPYQCAGSFKAEGYGSCLFSRMRGEDPSALIGLPLLKLIRMLENAGVEVV